jgi:alkylation response protein AidB-like acyl-CoA dehydrogenase
MEDAALRELRESFARWCEAEIVPHHREWEKMHRVPRELWHKAGERRFLCLTVASEYGGQGRDFRHSSVIIEELARCGATGVSFALHSDIIAPYIEIYGTEDQKQRWLPRMAAGELVAAIALTEPAGGSDLQAVRTTATPDGDQWVIDGNKTYVSNGLNHDLCLVLCRTEPQAGMHSLSLFVVERGTAGFHREELCEKMGYHALDTAELRFSGCRVPKANLLGARGAGLIQVMSRMAHERMVIAIHCLVTAKTVHGLCLDYAKRRLTFGQPLLQSQAIRFALAETATEISVSEAFIDRCIQHMSGGIDIVEASKAKYWTSEMLGRVADLAVQIHGGAGYMVNSAVGKAYVDARVQRIFGGTSEMLKEAIGRSL